MAGKRAAEASPTVPPPHKGKKQRTTALPPKTPRPQKPEPSRGSAAFVVPATPGTIVELPARGKQLPTTKNNNAKTPEPSAQKKRPAQKKQKTKQQPSSQQGGPPTTLPLEPHTAILGALQAKYAVRVLSVISSTRMEKRIKTILDHLGGAGSTGSTGAALPGVVLLHARAPDANKLVSIAEIVKRRIREGQFAEAPAADQMTDDPPPPANTKNSSKKKNKRKSTQASAVAWYQYDRIYDVQTARKKKTKTTSGDATKDGDGNEAVNDDDGDDDEEEEDDGFEPMMHRLESALVGGAQGSATKVTTYMSILLSRVPLSELHKNPEISVQCSTDPLEVEYEEYMAGA